jgi:outer membrane protein OmpA-like peptidoglycan-associated protein
VTDETVTDETVTDDVTDESAADDAMADDDAAEDETASSEDEAITDAEAEEMPEDAAEPVIEGTAAAEAEAEAEAETAGDDDLLLETGEGEVTTEEVTDETSRSSGEEFETTSSGDTAAQVEQSGMSNFEKALLLGLGTIAVGAVLANGARIVNNTGDRIIIEQPDGTYRVLKNDDVILRRPGSEVRTRTYEDGSTRTVITHPNGVRIATVRAADGTALKRVRVMPNGDRYVLFDDTLEVEPVRTVQRRTPTQDIETTDSDALREALIASMNADVGRSFSLGQIRAFKQVRELAPKIEVRDITFATDSAAIRAEQAERLADLGLAIADVIAEVPDAVFLVEGHTDAVGAASYNLALSDRRAESVALALTEYFDVPPENLVTQGYGESELKVLTASSERANRRVVVRNITPLLR